MLLFVQYDNIISNADWVTKKKYHKISQWLDFALLLSIVYGAMSFITIL